jgi:hypothetical protein
MTFGIALFASTTASQAQEHSPYLRCRVRCRLIDTRLDRTHACVAEAQALDAGRLAARGAAHDSGARSQCNGHAVLTVKTDRGEYILDNQTDDILFWADTGYRFVKRQSQSDPNGWVSLWRATRGAGHGIIALSTRERIRAPGHVPTSPGTRIESAGFFDTF